MKKTGLMVESITTKIIIYKGIMIDKGQMKHLRKQGYLGVDPGSGGVQHYRNQKMSKRYLGKILIKKKEHKGDSGWGVHSWPSTENIVNL